MSPISMNMKQIWRNSIFPLLFTNNSGITGAESKRKGNCDTPPLMNHFDKSAYNKLLYDFESNREPLSTSKMRSNTFGSIKRMLLTCINNKTYSFFWCPSLSKSQLSIQSNINWMPEHSETFIRLYTKYLPTLLQPFIS